MNPKKSLLSTLLTGALLLIGADAEAALQGRDLDGNAATFEAYYDTDLNITWLGYENYAETSGVDHDGKQSWGAAKSWAASLSFSVGGNTYSDWRLPTGDTTCYGLNCTLSEMGHLFYNELGGTAGQSILTSTDTDLANFVNLKASTYWTGTTYASTFVYTFEFGGGSQLTHGTDASSYFYALAVSPGDIVAAPIPEPETYALMLAGLGLVGFAARRQRQF